MLLVSPAEGRPLPNQVSPIDAPDDFFRVRLLCTLLDTCGMCFDRGSLKKRLDEYLIFLNVSRMQLDTTGNRAQIERRACMFLLS